MPRFHSRKAKAKSSQRQLFCSGMSIQQICRASHQRCPKFVILQRMEVIFSHTTALDLLRIWSCNHPLALRAFHDLRSRDVGHLPSSHLKGFSSLAHAADTEAAVRAAIESAKRPSLKRMLEELWDNATVERPLHVLARPKEGQPSYEARSLPSDCGASATRSLSGDCSRYCPVLPGARICSDGRVPLWPGELIALGYGALRVLPFGCRTVECTCADAACNARATCCVREARRAH